MEVEREKMLARVGNFPPQESIFEIGARRGGRKNNEEAVDTIRQIRSGMESRKQKIADAAQKSSGLVDDKAPGTVRQESEDEGSEPEADFDLSDGGSDADAMSEESSADLEVTFSEPYAEKSKTSNSKTKSQSQDDADFRDPENFMSYLPTNQNLTSDRAYDVHSGSNMSNFVESARSATMDLGADKSSKTFSENRQVMRWDKRHKKYVRRENDEDGSKGRKLVRGESGAKIAANFRSGRFDRWQKSNRVGKVARVGEEEKTSSNTPGQNGLGGKRFTHKTQRTPKLPDNLRGDYDKQMAKSKGAKERGKAS